MLEQYDLIVIGGGPGGYSGAIRAAQHGLKVALVEKSKVGGTCLHLGCIPTKTLLHTAELYREATENFPLIGLECKDITCNVETMYENKNQVVEQLCSGIEQLLQANGVTLLKGTGIVLEKNQVKIQEENKIIIGKNILVATGSRPALPPIEGIKADGVLTSDELLTNPVLYDHILIIGAGVIGIEFASFYTALGRKVTLLEAQARALPTLSREVGQTVAMMLKKRGATLQTSAFVQRFEKSVDKVTCWYTKKDEMICVEADAVLVATGRVPVIEEVFAETVKPVLEKGFVVVNENYQTSIPNIYAIGDIIPGAQLAHAASAEALAAVDAIMGVPKTADNKVIPSCIYTDPEIACAGITEEEAAQKGLSVEVNKFLLGGNGRTLIAKTDRSYIKLMAEKETGILVGAEFVCPRATDMIASAVYAIQNRMPVSSLEDIVWAHPTMSEGIGEAASLFGLGAIHAAPRKKRM